MRTLDRAATGGFGGDRWRSLRTILIALPVCGLALAVPTAEAVVGGSPARLVDYPYFAVVGTGCGGTLVRPGRVLTAAHCVEAIGERPQVRVGPDRLKRRIVRHAILPLHVRELNRMEREFPPPAGDLMLLQLDRPVRGVAPARIATPEAGLTAPGTDVTTIGRGASAADGSGQGVFRSGQVRIQAPSTCADALGDALLIRWSVCTRDPRMADPGDPGPFVSACFGDSGGPLLAGPGAARRVIGVVSWGAACGSMRDPEIYANAVRGRSFALAQIPVWAAQTIGRPRVVGAARAGHRIRCLVRWAVRPAKGLTYTFVLDGRQVRASRKPVYLLPASARGKKVSCGAGGATPGGKGGSRGLARYRLVR